ncbi:MAG: hypothetical protein D3918_13940 [Candidatus Electrothrix sp. AX2]|nr:hypothetical protein [Candidatus Electrothrix gigas]
MKTQEEILLLSILDNLHVRHESILLDNASDYIPILESIIEGIVDGIAKKKTLKKSKKDGKNCTDMQKSLCWNSVSETESTKKNLIT